MEKVKKINPLYLLSYIFVPIILCGISYGISYLFFPKGNGAVICLLVVPVLAILWWVFGGSFLYKRHYKKFECELEEKGFRRNHSFYGKGKTVYIDAENGQVGLVFFWNPQKAYILPASRIEKCWVDDGKGGAGFMTGSSRVGFLFIVDGIKVRVDTFTSNQRFRMDSDYILTGISKADVMVKAIEQAKARLN